MERVQVDRDLMRTLVDVISHDMSHGAPFSQVEAEVIEPAPLDDERKAALWMYAWSFQAPSRQREEALQHILMLEETL